ncbi:hypothetical protein GCHA_3189 [Paraglaciecola chathamensis S18K6]|uniref:Uncharacterized protein n=1 Tax=Paraglaciecola chathamensis S18K6 TaxID=1127672 RepID=A0AAV3V1T1_9ALTE|nr:hypothetical protein GCHA_3189 [Paraglaciecola chathamensis S18K6]
MGAIGNAPSRKNLAWYTAELNTQAINVAFCLEQTVKWLREHN